jgi:phosphate transport system protein
MNHLEVEKKRLKESVIEMMQLCQLQHRKAKNAFMNMDVEIAEEVRHNEKRMNAIELSIDRDCENMFALFNPVAGDLRYVISVMKINSDLERIGDYAANIADYVIDLNQEILKEASEETGIAKMFDLAIEMLVDIQRSFAEDDTALARKVFKRDTELNIINQNASRIISKYVKEDPDQFRPLLFLFSTIRKLERVGDHAKNVAENIIFYREAEVLKHASPRKD